MTEDVIEQVLRERVATLVVAALAWPVQWPNTSISVRDDAAFLKVTNVWTESEQVTAGRNPRFRDRGTLILSLFTPLDAGEKASLDASVIVRAAMRATSVGDLTLRTPSLSKLGARGKWYQVNVNCPWYADNHIIA